VLVPLGRPDQWRPAEILDQVTLDYQAGPVWQVPTTDRVLVAFTAEGVPRAIPARCPHRGMPLAEYGRHGRQAGLLVCTAHGYEFDVASGRCLNPGVCPLALPVWELVERADGTVDAVLPDDPPPTQA
jgi:nitrite reductase/ring-hydroxylating ferredoxin subunit